MDDESVDFAVAAWREEGLWQVVSLPPRAGESLENLVGALRAQPGEGGVLGLVSVAEEFFLLVRVLGEDVRLLLSDLFAAEDWPIGLDALDRIAAVAPIDEEEGDDAVPAGDLRLVEDFGLGQEELELMLDDPDAWPDELLATIAARLGFGEQFDLTLEQLPE